MHQELGSSSWTPFVPTQTICRAWTVYVSGGQDPAPSGDHRPIWPPVVCTGVHNGCSSGNVANVPSV